MKPAPVDADRAQQLRDLRHKLKGSPPLVPLTVNEEDSIVTTLKGEQLGSALFCEALYQASPRVIIRAAKECVLSPATATVNRKRFTFLLDHLLKVLTQTPKMELSQK